jgi:hypothetical protein
MENREFDFDEPIICCSHNFDTSNRDNFANELATRLGVNINIMELGGEVIDTIKIPNATITKNLNCLNPKYDKFFKYALEFGDEAHVIANDYLQYILPASVDYLKLIDFLKEQTESNDDDSYSFNELKKFGATEVYIGNMEEVNLTDEDKKDWSKVLKVLTKSNNHYCYKLV